MREPQQQPRRFRVIKVCDMRTNEAAEFAEKTFKRQIDRTNLETTPDEIAVWSDGAWKDLEWGSKPLRAGSAIAFVGLKKKQLEIRSFSHINLENSDVVEFMAIYEALDHAINMFTVIEESKKKLPTPTITIRLFTDSDVSLEMLEDPRKIPREWRQACEIYDHVLDEVATILEDDPNVVLEFRWMPRNSIHPHKLTDNYSKEARKAGTGGAFMQAAGLRTMDSIKLEGAPIPSLSNLGVPSPGPTNAWEKIYSTATRE